MQTQAEARIWDEVKRANAQAVTLTVVGLIAQLADEYDKIVDYCADATTAPFQPTEIAQGIEDVLAAELTNRRAMRIAEHRA